MEEGFGPGIVAAVGELSQEEAGELSLQSWWLGGPSPIQYLDGRPPGKN